MKYYIPIIVLLLIPAVLLGIGFYRCFNPENMVNYGNEEYIFVIVSIGSGRSNNIDAGTIKVSDYQKWLNGESGTIFLYSTIRENMGRRINISSIVSITNYGSKPRWLPLNFESL